MKSIASALILAFLLANPASAYVFTYSEHDYTTIVHVEVVGATHAPSGKRK